MESAYFILVIVLFALAISDLMVGVGNDAVNFLNSAFGAKVASVRIILAFAAIGVFVGASFSGGMMEVARSGIFHPQQFYFNEIMFICIAVMITDVILLDVFNTLGFPTSTTVSIVFELLGAAVALALVKIKTDPYAAQAITDYINSASALKIITSILLSVAIAFTFGSIFQYLFRLIFTFNYEKTLKRYGSLFTGFSMTMIVYFLLVKGVKGAAFMTDEVKLFIANNSTFINLGCFVFFTLATQILMWLTRFNPLKMIVLVGTFALAMAFAGNDLVNFIGVPMAGYESFRLWHAQGAAPELFQMQGLQGDIKTNPLFLIIAGIVMVLTLYFSKKAKTVIKTSVNLGRQSEGYERFNSTQLSRSIVRYSRGISEQLGRFVPNGVKTRIKKRFELTEIKKTKDDPAFDLIRAAVILVVSSALIALGTSFKLPLSTTYVTFMVAMGASLSDKSWGRESAVYRITGVFTVIGGWFLTAFLAFTVAFILALIIALTKFIGIAVLIIVGLYMLYRSRLVHNKREHQEELEIHEQEETGELPTRNLFEKCLITTAAVLKTVSTSYQSTINSLIKEDRKKLKASLDDIIELNSKTKMLKNNVSNVINRLPEGDVEAGHYYVQVLDYLREIAHCMTFISRPAFDHIDNNHKGLLKSQVEELKKISDMVIEFLNFVQFVMKENKYSDIDEIISKQQLMINEIANIKKNHVKRIKNTEAGTRNTLLYFELLAETKNLLLFTVNMLKAQRDFVKENKNLLKSEYLKV